ncbi:MAG: hypothetical protein ABI433_07190 [Burkholderiaceae bacterium]
MGFFSDLTGSIFGGSGSGNNKTNTSTADSSTKSTTNQYDNRVVLGNDAVQLGAGADYSRDSNNTTLNRTSFEVNDSSVHDLSTHNATSFLVNDSSSRDYSTSNDTSFLVNDSRNQSSVITDARNLSDASSRSYLNSGNTTINSTDGGAVDIARFNAQLLQSVSQNQGDTVRLLAAMGADGISRQAEAATNLFATAADNSAASWTHTVDKSADLIDRLLMTAQGTIAGANAVATKAVDSFTPTANKQADAFKWAAIAAGVLIAFKLFKA